MSFFFFGSHLNKLLPNYGCSQKFFSYPTLYAYDCCPIGRDPFFPFPGLSLLFSPFPRPSILFFFLCTRLQASNFLLFLAVLSPSSPLFCLRFSPSNAGAETTPPRAVRIYLFLCPSCPFLLLFFKIGIANFQVPPVLLYHLFVNYISPGFSPFFFFYRTFFYV